MQREQGCEQIRVTTLEKPRKYVFFLLLTHPRPFVHSSSKERLAYCSVLNNSPAPVWDYDDYSAQLPGLSYWGQDFYLFFARMTIKPGLFTKLLPRRTYSWIFTKQIGTPDDYSVPCIYLFSAWMIIKHLTLTELLPVLLIAVFYYRSELPALAEIDKRSGKKNDCIWETKLRYFL